MSSFFRYGPDPNDRFILSANGFVVEEPTCYMPVQIETLLQRHGPLWIASAVPKPHIRVVCGLAGRTLSINDPSPVGKGSRYRRTFADVFGKQERLGTKESSQSAPVYLAHLA